MTPLESAAIAYVRAMRNIDPGAQTVAWLELTEKADAVERRTPSSASKLPDARSVVAEALPADDEVGDTLSGLARARAALASRGDQ